MRHLQDRGAINAVLLVKSNTTSLQLHVRSLPQHFPLLNLLLDAELVCVSALLFSAVDCPRVQASIAPAEDNFVKRTQDPHLTHIYLGKSTNGTIS